MNLQNKHAKRPVALVTGASRPIGIGAAIALSLARAGWDVAITYWQPYDAEMPWESDASDVDLLLKALQAIAPKIKAVGIEANLSQPDSAETIFNFVEQNLGQVDALILSHCLSIDSSILDTTVEAFDNHFAINSRATWLLVREFGRRYSGEFGSGRIVSITSDHTAHNMPYGASKGAMDRIVLAAAHEFKHLGITANVVNPGATDTGWMDDNIKDWAANATPLGRVGMPQDCANLVTFLCSQEGGWINAQLIKSNGGQAS